MILGIDHLALSAGAPDHIAGVLPASGFVRAFCEHDLHNAPAKREILGTYRPVHDIALWRSRRAGVSLETTDHGPPSNRSPGPYQPVITGRIQGAEPREAADDENDCADALRSALGSNVVAVRWRSPVAEFWHLVEDDPGEAAIASIIVKAPDPDEESVFWIRGVGWEPVDHVEGRWWRLRAASPIAALRAEVVIVRSRRSVSPLLDAAGFPCLALLTSDLIGDAARMCKAGGRMITDRFSLTVNNRSLAIGFVRAPHGALVELVEPAR